MQIGKDEAGRIREDTRHLKKAEISSGELIVQFELFEITCEGIRYVFERYV